MTSVNNVSRWYHEDFCRQGLNISSSCCLLYISFTYNIENLVQCEQMVSWGLLQTRSEYQFFMLSAIHFFHLQHWEFGSKSSDILLLIFSPSSHHLFVLKCIKDVRRYSLLVIPRNKRSIAFPFWKYHLSQALSWYSVERFNGFF